MFFISGDIYNIRDQVNWSIITALIQLNKTVDTRELYYWVDIDRTCNEGFTWKYCPVSGKELILLGDNYPNKNSFTSPEYPLIFPI